MTSNAPIIASGTVVNVMNISVVATPSSLPSVVAITVPTVEENHWAAGFFDCFSYRDENNNCLWCPNFWPCSFGCPFCMVGKIETLMHEEPHICFEIGRKGFFHCAISASFNILVSFVAILARLDD